MVDAGMVSCEDKNNKNSKDRKESKGLSGMVRPAGGLAVVKASFVSCFLVV
jgi:hypothetical protein